MNVSHSLTSRRRGFAWSGFIRAARMLKSEGSFGGLASLVPYPELNALFTTALPGPVDRACGRSESFDPDDVGDIADEGAGHRG